MPKERIGIFATFLQGGGLERVLLNLMEGFIDRGYAVDLLLFTAEGPFVELIPDDVQVINLGSPRIRASIQTVRQYLRKEKPKVLYCAESDRGFEGVVAGLLSMSGTRVMIGIHTIEANERPDYLDDRHKKYLMIKRFVCPLASKVIPVSHGLIDAITKDLSVPKRKMHVIYNPVVTEKLTTDMHKPVDHKWFKEKTIPVVLTAGRLVDIKGYDVLIRAFKEAIPHVEARLLILGEGDQRESLTALVQELELEDYVDMPGFVDNPYAYMKNADLFVLSSEFEGLPTVVIEALACGTPVVSTKCPGGLSEILQHGEYGTLVPVGDHKALGQAIVEALQSDHDISKLEKRAEDFSEDKSIDDYLKAFQLK